MAGIDRIYGSDADYDLFYNWCKNRAPMCLKYFYPKEGYGNSDDRPIANFPKHIDRWLWKCCCVPFVWNRLKEQYSNGPKPHPKHWSKWDKIKRRPWMTSYAWTYYINSKYGWA